MAEEIAQVEGQTTEIAGTETSATSTEQTEQSTEATAAAAAAAATPEGEAAAAATAATEAEARRDTNAEKRIKQLSSRANRAETTVQTLQSANTELQNQVTALKAPVAADFQNDADHTAAVIKHAVTESSLTNQINANTREAGRVQADSQAEKLEYVTSQVAAFSAENPDYQTSTGKLTGLHALSGSVMQVDNVPEVYYALSKNLPLAVAINAMPEMQRLVELGRLSAGVTPQATNISSAPAPVNSANSGGGAATSGDPSEMKMKDFSQWYDSRGAA